MACRERSRSSATPCVTGGVAGSIASGAASPML